MPIETSIYGNIRQPEMPSYLDAAGKASNLTSMAMQQKRMGQEMGEADRQAHLQKASMFGNALEGLAGLKEPERAAAYPKMHAELVQAGVLSPDQAPADYDPGFYRQSLMKYRQTAPAIENQLKQAQIAKMKAEASKDARGESDPLARQMAMQDYRDAAERRKKDEELKRYSQVGGWKLTEGATPTPDDAKKFKAGVSAARSLLDNLNQYQSLVSTYGSEMGGKVAQRMDSLARDIQLAAKNEDLYGLGVLTGPDLALLEEIIQAPTGVGAKLNPFAGSKATNKAQQFREMMNTRIGAKAKTYGFEAEPEWQRLAAGGQGPNERRGGSPLGGNEAVAGAPAIKPGTLEEGHVYMGGDPANPKSWKKAR